MNKSMARRIRVTSDELNYNKPYTFTLTERQAYQVLNARPGEEVSLGKAGAFVHVHDASALSVRVGDRGGTAVLSRADVLRQINEALARRGRAGD